jgi:hypothetical protein
VNPVQAVYAVLAGLGISSFVTGAIALLRSARSTPAEGSRSRSRLKPFGRGPTPGTTMRVPDHTPAQAGELRSPHDQAD